MTGRLPRPSECRACHEPIRFVKLDTGSIIPVNPRPAPDNGNVAAQLVGGRLIGHVIAHDKPARAAQPFRFRPHFATCENLPARQQSDPAPAVEIDDEALW